MGRGGLAPVRPLRSVPGRRAASPAGPAPSSRAGRARAAQPCGSLPALDVSPAAPAGGLGRRAAAAAPPPCPAARFSASGCSFLRLGRAAGLPAGSGWGCGAGWRV